MEDNTEFSLTELKKNPVQVVKGRNTMRYLELIGEVGGEEGAGKSFSSSSSSSHSSSLRGVILFPSHTECIETLNTKNV